MTNMINEHEAAKMLGVSVRLLQKWRVDAACKSYHKESRGPAYYKLGRSVRYDPDEVAEYTAKRRVVPGGDR